MSECRVCLVDNVRMLSIRNTRFKEIYEKLAGTELNTEDGRPSTVCYVCSSLLQKFGKFIDMVQKAEHILTIRLGGIEMSQKTQDNLKLYNLATTSIQSTSFIDNGEDIEPEVTVTIKEEPVDSEETEEYTEEYLDSSPTSDEIFHEADRSEDTTLILAAQDLEETTPILASQDLEKITPIHASKGLKEMTPILAPKALEKITPKLASKGIEKTTPILASQGLNEPIESDKATLMPDITNMEFSQEDVSIKKEPIEPEDNSGITQSILRYIALETLPEHKLDLKYFPHNSIRAGNRAFRYFCSKCNYKSRTAGALRKHTKVHDPSYKYACEFCLYRFVTDKKLAAHKNYCTVCSICGKKLSNIHGLRIHVRLHTGIQPYSCDSCGRGFNQKTNLQTHMRVHSRQHQYPCKICNKTFPFKTYLERHMLLHGENPLDTESFRRTVNCHKLFIPKVNKPCACSLCGRILQSKKGLDVHMRQHTGERPYSCEACARVFTQKYNLLTHIERVHAGDESFSCKVCRMVFPSNWEMKRHLSSHYDEEASARNFEMFQQKHIYAIHRRVGHNGQFTPYPCDMCKTRILSY